MKIFCGMLVIFCLVGCSSNPPKLDEQCNKIANYARGVTQWKAIGASIEDISFVSSNPTTLTFQQAYIRNRIYNNDVMDPHRSYTRFYHECVMYGYDNTMAAYEKQMISNINRKIIK